MSALKYDVVTLKSACEIIPSRCNKCILSLEVLNDMIGCSLKVSISWCSSTELNLLIEAKHTFCVAEPSPSCAAFSLVCNSSLSCSDFSSC